jgi:hypothetical protein
MVSDTTKTENRRRRRSRTNGRKAKKLRARAGTPSFPIHPEGAPKSTSK